MKRLILLSVIASLACSATHATDYVWSAGAVTLPYDCVTAYTPNITPPLTAADLLIMDNNAGGTSARMLFPAAGTITLGGLEFDCGSLDFQNSTATIRLASGSGQNGDLIIQYSGFWYGYGGNKTFDVDGNVALRSYNTGMSAYSPGYTNLVMRGVGKTLSVNHNGDPNSGWRTLTIYNGASISAGTTAATQAWSRSLFIDGTIAGGDWVVTAPNATGVGIVRFGPSGAFAGGKLIIDAFPSGTNPSFQYLDLGGGTYPAIDISDTAYNGNLQRRMVRLKGDVTVTNDFVLGKDFAYYAPQRRGVFDTDNGSGVIHDLTVGGNFRIGQNAPAGTNHHTGFFANSSTIDIGGGATFDRFGYVKGGTSTWKFGGNVSFIYGVDRFRFDNTDMAGTTAILDGSTNQTLRIGDCVTMGNLVIKKSGGDIILDCSITLAGNFTIDPANVMGNYVNNGYYINLKGGIDCETLAQQIDALGSNLRRVAILQGSNTYVKLMSDLMISDNLDIDAGCKLFLNGFTLDLTGSDAAAFLGQNMLSGPGSWTLSEGGEIVGSEIPEPASLLLMGTGALGVLGWIRRRRMR